MKGSLVMLARPGAGRSGRRGFTLIELLVVIVILAILVALTTVGVMKAMDTSRASTTQAMLDSIGGALAQYAQRWGDYPPTTVDEIGLHAPNEVNNGIESLVACLSSQKRGGALIHYDEQLTNVDNDSAPGAKRVTNWVFGDDQLHEWMDNFGFTLIYMHHKDYAKAKASLTTVKLYPGAETIKVPPEMNPTTKTYYNVDRYQLRSVGKDGKPGTGDDIRASN
jgi:prepilin-type N-terminal cleavage/methylation domain-containing protein